MRIGLLALQGGYALHEEKLHQLGVSTKRIVTADDLAEISGLIMPGGESSTMLKNAPQGIRDAIKHFADAHPVWGTCAGSVLMAAHVENPRQHSLSIIDIDIVRNAYGDQNHSFIVDLKFNLLTSFSCECMFIRAPKIARLGDDVILLAEYDGDAICVEQGRHLVTTFHPELSNCTNFHQYFVTKVKNH